MKIHHAMVDGKSALAVALLLLDLDPDAPEPTLPAEPWAGDPAPGPARLAVEALVESGAEPLRALGRAARAAGSPPRLGGTLRRAALAVGEDVARSAPSSFLNPPIGPRRTLVGHTVPVRRLLDVKEAWGGSLNDVALTVVAGALRQLALLRRVAPAPIKVMVPVSRRGEDEAAAMGNRIAFVFITLPVHLRDPLARLVAIRDETAAFKDSERASGGEALLRGLGVLPPALQAPVARYAASARMYNLVVSNVPGPRIPVYLLGAECVEVLPAIPLSEGHALSIGVFTLSDRVCFGAYADPEALPQASELPAALDVATLELSAISAQPAHPQWKPRAAAGATRTARPSPSRAERRCSAARTRTPERPAGGRAPTAVEATHATPSPPPITRKASSIAQPAGAGDGEQRRAGRHGGQAAGHRGRGATRGAASEPAMTARLSGVNSSPAMTGETPPRWTASTARNIAGVVVAVSATATSAPRASPGARSDPGGTSGARDRRWIAANPASSSSPGRAARAWRRRPGRRAPRG